MAGTLARRPYIVGSIVGTLNFSPQSSEPREILIRVYRCQVNGDEGVRARTMALQYTPSLVPDGIPSLIDNKKKLKKLKRSIER